MKNSEQVVLEISAYFGCLPPFFAAAQETPEVMNNLWQQTLSAYINNPLPKLFIEKLFAYLSRYCSVPYCLVHHSCALLPLGMTPSQVLQLLESPAPTQTEIEAHLQALAASTYSLTSLSEPEAIEKAIFSCCIYTFLQPNHNVGCCNQLQQILGLSNYNHLIAFLAYIKTCHLWVEAHPALTYQIDRSAQGSLEALFAQEPRLVDFCRNYSELIKWERQNQEGQVAPAVGAREAKPIRALAKRCGEWQGDRRQETGELGTTNYELGIKDSPPALSSGGRWADIVENASWGVVVVSADGKTLEIMNPAFAKMHGCTVEELVSKPITKICSPECCGELPEYVRIAQEKGSYTFETKHKRKNGSIFPVFVDVTTVKDKDGKVLYYAVNVQDISDRVAAEEKLRQNEELFHQITENIRQVFWIAAPDRQIFYVSPAYEEIWGRSPQKLYENPASFLDTIHPEDRDRIVAAWPKQIQKEYEVEYRIIHPNSSIRWIRDRAFTILNQQGEIERIVGIADDFTERKQLQEELRESEERLRLVLEAVHMGIWDWNILTNKVTWSNNLEALFGLEKGTFEGTYEAFLKYIHPQDREFVQQSVIQAVQEGAEYDIEFRVVWSDGTIRWAASKGNVFHDAVGNPVRMAGVDIDITARKRVEEELRLLESVVVNAKDAILITEAEPIEEPGPRIVYANAAFTRMTGYTCEEVLGKNPRFLQGSKSDRATLDKIRAALKCWEPVCVELINYRKDSSQFWVEISIVPVKDQIGRYTHWIAIQRDITERKQAEVEHQQLLAAEQAARATAEAANRTKDEFLAIVSHELRSPLNVMLGWARLLRTRKFDQAKTANGLEIIERNARLQTELIEDLLDISRIIRGKLHLNFSKVNLISVIQAAMDVVRSTAESKNIQLDFRLDSEEGEAEKMGRMSDSQAISAPHRPIRSQQLLQGGDLGESLRVLSPDQAKTSSLLVSGDPVRLQQIIWNLLSNAVKFTPEGGRVAVELSAISDRGSVEGKQQTTDRYAQITVSDTGKGITPEFLPYVFERFRQADSSITRSQAGLGLGLAIVRSLVELHNGTVSAESPGEGQGSTFTIKLPLLEHSNPAEVQGSRGEGNYQPPAPSLHGFQLLVVDDEADAREFVTTVLEQYGAKVIAVASVSEALEAMERSQPDVLVSDIGMPGENGYSLIRKLRQLEAERGGRIPAIALTAYARSEDRAAAIAAGFQLHVSKPVDPAQLAAVVANIVKRK